MTGETNTSECDCCGRRVPFEQLSKSHIGGLETYACAECSDHDDEDAEPCTSAARRAGCTCSMESVNSASIDPPEPIIERGCPLHGDHRDPSDLYKAQRDDDQYFAQHFAAIDDDGF